jgi:predicted MFS family arabinose efflux permease
VNSVTPENRGSALGVYTAFADLSLGVTGPLVGLIVAGFGYSNIFLFAALAAMIALGIAVSLHRRTRLSFPGGQCEFAGAD